MCCYVWPLKKYKVPYVGFVEGDKMTHPNLLQEKRARMKIFLVDPGKNIPVKMLDAIFKLALKAVKQERVWLRSPNKRSR